MNRLYALFITILLLILVTTPAEGQISENLDISGYLQATPVWMQARLPDEQGVPGAGDRESWWEYRMQNRLNLSWYATGDLSFHWQMRTRLFAGDTVRDFPFYPDLTGRDDGLVNLSWMPVREESWFLHYIPDRLYGEWDSGDWNIRFGRQRINWGINMVTNPNDLFNIYSFYDFDYPERPGTDAVRIRRYTGTLSRWELAWSPARESRQSTAALLYGFNRSGYDIQLLGGYYRHRLALGGGWAGNLRTTGFKGEVMLFTDLEGNEGDHETDLIVALSADHMFDNSLFLVVEGLYNQGGGAPLSLLSDQPLSADNPAFSRWQFTSQVTYPFSPISQGSLAAIWYPDEEALFLSPSISRELRQNLDFTLLTQLFLGSGDSPLANAGRVAVASLKWNF